MSYPRSPPMSAKYGSCFAARMLLLIVCEFVPQSPPDTNVKVSVAFAGIVRKLYDLVPLPIWNR